MNSDSSKTPKRSRRLRRLEAVFPAECRQCGRFLPWEVGNRFLCASCEPYLPWLNPSALCETCGLPEEAHEASLLTCRSANWSLNATWAACAYADPVRSWILRFKFGKQENWAPLLAWLMSESAPQVSVPRPSLLMPVPLHPERLRARGFNQSLLLAHALRSPQWELCLRGMQRVRSTRPQVSLDWEARQKNPENAFAVQAEVSGRSVVLVDDVMTTGATLNEMARVLKQQGAAQVTAWVVARRFREDPPEESVPPT
ncbi:MAG: ComF family protein [bacterium]